MKNRILFHLENKKIGNIKEAFLITRMINDLLSQVEQFLLLCLYIYIYIYLSACVGVFLLARLCLLAARR